MTIREIIAELQRQGYKVEFTERYETLSKKEIKRLARKYADDPTRIEHFATTKYARGVRITAIDGVKFSGSKGNIAARQMLGKTLSVKQEQQLEKIRIPRVAPLPQNILKKLEKVQRLSRKLRKQQTEAERLDPKKSIPKITRKNIRYTLQHGGEQAVLTQLDNYERKIKKLVPTWLWDDLVQRVHSWDVFFSEVSEEAGAMEFYNKWKELLELIDSADIDKIKFYDDYNPLLEALYVLLSDYAGVNYVAEGTPALDGMLVIARRIQ